jgi:hypothetical protein
VANKSSKTAPKHTVYRSSIKGTFVTEQYAKGHPKTTEKEIVP